MTTWNVFSGGYYIGQVTAKTAAAALRKARYEWGSSSELSDAQLAKFTVRKANPAAKRKGTKAERAMASQRASRKRGLHKAVATLMKKLNPGRKVDAVSITKLKGGGVSVKPVKVRVK